MEFEQSEYPGKFRLDHGVALTPSFRTQHFPLHQAFAERFAENQINIDVRRFTNDMPLYLVGNARNALMLATVNGTDWEQVHAEIGHIGSALTMDIDAAGPNVERLGVMMPFIDGRQDKKTRKQVPESDERAIVRSQSVSMVAFARELRHVAGADYVVTLDLHSYDAAKRLEKEGLEHIHLTAIPLFAQRIKDLGLLEDGVETIVSTTDLGSLQRSMVLAEELNTDLAVIVKDRTSAKPGIDTTTTQTVSRFAYGDVRGKRVITMDDMISSGGTGISAVEELLDAGAEDIIQCATHPVFVGDYYKNLQILLGHPQVKKILVTNSIPIEDRRPAGASVPYVRVNGERKEVEVLSINDYMVKAAQIILDADSLDQAIKELGNRVMKLKNPYELFADVTDRSIEEPKDTKIYHRGGNLTSLDGSTT